MADVNITTSTTTPTKSVASKIINSSDVRQLCLLSLDGGGVRGLSSLQILKQLMETINPDNPPKPCDYFDMIAGTSTGGLIAIMLGRLRMSVDACMDAYIHMSDKIFQKKRHRFTFTGQVQGRFDSDELERAVKQVLTDQGMDPNELLQDDPSARCKVFVCATSAETSDIVHLASFRSPRGRQHLYKVCKIWEAVRATSAASSFFEPIIIGDYKEKFIDGATGANNPVGELVNEARDLWPHQAGGQIDEQIQCLVSIGTGVPGLKEFGSRLRDIVKVLKSISTETEKTAERFARDKGRLEEDGRYFRFNVLKGLEAIGLQESTKRNEIVAATGRYVESQTVFRQMRACASRLQARHEALTILPPPAPAQESQSQSPVESLSNSRHSAMEAFSSRIPHRSHTHPNEQSLAGQHQGTDQLPQPSRTQSQPQPQPQARSPTHISSPQDGHASLNEPSPQATPPVTSNDWDDGSSLHEAVELSDLDELSKLLSKAGVDPNAKDDQGNTPLRLAASKGDVGAIRILLRKGADPSAENDQGQNALHIAAEQGNMIAVGLLINRGGNIESEDIKGRTAIHYAAMGGHKDILELLKSKNATLNALDNEGNTPLHAAASMGKAEAIRYLVQNKVDARVKNSAGQTAAELAKSRGFEHIAIDMVFEADRRATEASGGTKLHWAAQNGHDSLMKAILSELGSEVNARNKDDCTPLNLAAQYGHVQAADILLDHGADIEASYRTEHSHREVLSPLLAAVQHEHKPLVELLLNRGANVAATTCNGRTALYLAASKGSDGIIVDLLGANAKWDSSDRPIFAAARAGFTSTTLLLLDTEKSPQAKAALANDLFMDALKSNNDELCLALIKQGNSDTTARGEKYPKMLWSTALDKVKPELVRALLDAGADPSMASEMHRSRRSLLQSCMVSGRSRRPTVQILLEHGALKSQEAKTFLAWAALNARDMADLVIDLSGVEIDAVDDKEQSALYYAVVHSDATLVKLLLDHGANPEGSPKARETPLQKACEFGDLSTVQALLDAGAGVDTPNADGETALVKAIEGHKEQIAQLLLERGANANVPRRARRTAVHCAVIARSSSVIQMLKHAGADMNATDEHGHTPLEFAARERELGTVRALVQAGADVSASPMALHYAIRKGGRDGKEMALFLLQHGAAVEARDYGDGNDAGDTPLFKAAAENQLEIGRVLLEHGVDPNTTNKRGETALFGAIAYNHEAFVKLLLDHGAAVTPGLASRTGEVRNPLAEALRTEYPTRTTLAIVKLLLDAGADPNGKDRFGAPVLRNAVEEASSEDLVKMLIERGADVAAKDTNGHGALQWAKRAQYRSRVAMDELLRGYGLQD